MYVCVCMYTYAWMNVCMCVCICMYSSGSRGVGGLTPPSEVFFLACQYMKIPTDLDPNPPPLEEFWPRTPLKEFLDPPLMYVCICMIGCIVCTRMYVHVYMCMCVISHA